MARWSSLGSLTCCAPARSSGSRLDHHPTKTVAVHPRRIRVVAATQGVYCLTGQLQQEEEEDWEDA